MPQDARTASATRIAVTLGSVVAVVMLLIWGATALAGALAGDLAPAPAEQVAKQPPKAAAPESEPVATATAATPEPTEPPAAQEQPVAKPAPKPAPAPPKPAPTSAKYTVVVDAGHQGRGDSSLEPIGPGASQKKPKVADGATGDVTGVRESVVNLAVSLKLRRVLEARGVRVVMVRTSENVNISNSERAKIGNRENADLVVRVHCDDLDNHTTNGFMTVVPDDNKWTRPWLGAARKAGGYIHRASLSATGAKDRGVKPPPQPMSGFNWSTVPSVIVEMGVMSYPAEDRRLSDPAYQQKLADGIGAGTMDYLETLR